MSVPADWLTPTWRHAGVGALMLWSYGFLLIGGLLRVRA